MNNNTEASCSPGARVRSLPPIIFSQPNAPGPQVNGQMSMTSDKQSITPHILTDSINLGDSIQVMSSGSSSCSVPPSPRTKFMDSAASPTPSVASFSSMYHSHPTPTKSKNKSKNGKKRNTNSDGNVADSFNNHQESGKSSGRSSSARAGSSGNPGTSSRYSPNVLRRFQAVKTGLSFVNNIKFKQQ